MNCNLEKLEAEYRAMGETIALMKAEAKNVMFKDLPICCLFKYTGSNRKNQISVKISDNKQIVVGGEGLWVQVRSCAENSKVTIIE